MRELRRSETFAIVLLAAFVIGAIVVPALATHDPLRMDDVLARRLVPPLSRDALGSWHLLGTDRFGRDLFVRMMLAGRLSLLVGVLGSVVTRLGRCTCSARIVSGVTCSHA